VYHAYENGYTNLGRQTLMEPLILGDDLWFHPVVVDSLGQSGDPCGRFEAPIQPMHPVASKEERLNEFRIGKEWRFYKKYNPGKVSVNNGDLTLQAEGSSPGSSYPMLFVAGTHSYEIECEVLLNDPSVSAGIVMYYDSVFYMGTGTSKKSRLRYRMGIQKGGRSHLQDQNGSHVWLRLRTFRNIVTGEYSYDGIHWQREEWAMDISGYNHNTLYQFQSVLPGLFCFGPKGSATFKNFKYKVLE